jgi:hypothetical protein
VTHMGVQRRFRKMARGGVNFRPIRIISSHHA